MCSTPLSHTDMPHHRSFTQHLFDDKEPFLTDCSPKPKQFGNGEKEWESFSSNFTNEFEWLKGEVEGLKSEVKNLKKTIKELKVTVNHWSC